MIDNNKIKKLYTEKVSKLLKFNKAYLYSQTLERKNFSIFESNLISGSFEIKNKKPPSKGPATVPSKKLDSSLANFTVLFSSEEVSATYAKDAGLVADPINPFINRPRTNAGNKSVTLKRFFSTRNKGVIRAINEIA